jgi:hypothetical protein
VWEILPIAVYNLRASVVNSTFCDSDSDAFVLCVVSITDSVKWDT